MIFYLILGVTIFLSLCIHTKWKKVKNYWQQRGVPHYPPHPIMGSLTFLQRENPALWMKKAYNDFKSPYIGMWLFWRPALVINSPEIVKRILVKDFDNFRNHFLASGETDPVGSLNMFTVKDPIWTSLRKRLAGMFTVAKLKNHNEMVQAKTVDLVERIRIETAKHKKVHLRSLLANYTTDIIGESAFGIKSESVKTGESIIKQVAKEFMEFSLYRGLCWSSIFFFPELVDIFRFSFFPKATVERLRHICRSVIKQRGGFEKEITDPKNLLETLIKMKQVAASEGEDVHEDFILAQASIFLLAGFDTTASTLSWAIYELAWHPEYQQRLYENLLCAKQKNDDKEFNPNCLTDFTQIDCIIKETLRLFGPLGWVDRVAAKDYIIDEKLTIPAGTPVYINSVGMQLDPEYFPDPMVFNPDRFLPENEGNIVPFTYKPFGEGPRRCMGMRMSYHVLRTALSALVYNFELRRVPNTPEPNDVQVENQGMLYLPLDDKMVVEFVPRKH